MGKSEIITKGKELCSFLQLLFNGKYYDQLIEISETTGIFEKYWLVYDT